MSDVVSPVDEPFKIIVMDIVGPYLCRDTLYSDDLGLCKKVS